MLNVLKKTKNKKVLRGKDVNVMLDQLGSSGTYSLGHIYRKRSVAKWRTSRWQGACRGGGANHFLIKIDLLNIAHCNFLDCRL